VSFAARHRGLALGGLSLVVVLAAWEGATRTGWIGPMFLSPPSLIATNGWTNLVEGRWTADLALTLSCFGAALTLAIVGGVLVGVAMGASKTAFHLLNPYLVALNALPKIVLCPLVMLWFGTGPGARVFLGSLMAAFPIVTATVTGVQSLDRDFVLLARTYRASRWKILHAVVLPFLAPHALSGIRVGVNYAMVGVLVVELFSSSQGLGYRLNAYSQNFQLDLFFAIIALIIAIVLVLSRLMYYLEVRLGGWRNSAFH